ncbi:UbiA prenyltransferase, partial [Peniophora sp. CONT]
YIQLTRLHKFPLGTAVIFWPAALGLAMAAYAFDTPARDFLRQAAVFGIGCTLLHSTFCILNDIFDRDLDGLVERTKTRPIVSGAVSVAGAYALFLGFLFATACPLIFANKQTITIGLLSLPLHILYPLTKRWTWWPQAWLGISNGWSFFVGWFSIAATHSSREQILAVFSAYIAMVCWTIYFDTVYATQDREDDARVGIKSTARLFGTWLREITACFAICTVVLLIYAGYLVEHGPAYYVLSCGGAMAHFTWQLSTWDLNSDKSSGKLFKSNNELGLIIFGGMVADYALKR